MRLNLAPKPGKFKSSQTLVIKRRELTLEEQIFQRKAKEPSRHLNQYEKQRKKYLARKERHSKLNEAQIELFNWMEDLFKKLGFYLNNNHLEVEDKKVATLLGLSQRTIRAYRRREGIFPSQETYQKLKELERELNKDASNII